MHNKLIPYHLHNENTTRISLKLTKFLNIHMFWIIQRIPYITSNKWISEPEYMYLFFFLLFLLWLFLPPLCTSNFKYCYDKKRDEKWKKKNNIYSDTCIIYVLFLFTYVLKTEQKTRIITTFFPTFHQQFFFIYISFCVTSRKSSIHDLHTAYYYKPLTLSPYCSAFSYHAFKCESVSNVLYFLAFATRIKTVELVMLVFTPYTYNIYVV